MENFPSDQSTVSAQDPPQLEKSAFFKYVFKSNRVMSYYL
jgi:hypothetical protein